MVHPVSSNETPIYLILSTLHQYTIVCFGEEKLLGISKVKLMYFKLIRSMLWLLKRGQKSLIFLTAMTIIPDYPDG